MEFHEVSGIFPMMSAEEYQALKSDIQVNGLREPIWLFENKIIDGRNRFKACEETSVKPKFKNWDGKGSLVGFVVSLNLHRRHLNPSQRAAIGTDLEPRFAEEAKKRQQEQARRNQPQADSQKVETLPPIEKAKSRDQAASVMQVSGKLVSDAKAIKKESPELFEAVKTGKTTVSKAKKQIKKAKKQKELAVAQQKVTEEKRNDIHSVCDIRCCSFDELLPSIKPDALVTDPPYPREFLPLYGHLAELSKNIPVVAVMCGQSYLPEIMEAMCRHLKYRWTLAYLTPGGQSVQLWQAKVNTFWKPVLLFGEAMDWIGDVLKSAPNDNDKRFHEWGQSESGMADLIGKITGPGQLVCDPFVGGGTTAVVSLALGRKFVGCDINQECVNKSIQRCEVASL